MNPTHRMPAVLAVLAVTVIGCSQLSGGSTAGAGQATTSASAPSSSVEPSVAATAQEETAAPQPPAEFSGRIDCGPPVRSDSEETLNVGEEGMVLNRYRGGAWQQTVTMTDPRLEGTVHHTYESDEYRVAGAEEGPDIFAATHRIENEQGAWVGLDIGGSFADGTSIGDPPEVFAGEGAYEGLTALMMSTSVEGTCAVEVRGIIFHGAPVPEPYLEP